MRQKLIEIENRLACLSNAAVAFSGGTDSTFLLAVAKKVNIEKLIAVTVSSVFVAKREIQYAKKMAQHIGIEHLVLDVDILGDESVVQNTKERCYFCKSNIFLRIKEKAGNLGYDVFLHAVNLDDLNDFRPGLKAAKALDFMSPLADAKCTKAEIRQLSRQMELDTWNKPSQSCLATRIPYGTRISPESLAMVDAAEALLQDLGFAQVRVRCHGRAARIEVEPDRIETLMDKTLRQKIAVAFARIGFEHTSIDIDGYYTGKMNRIVLETPS